MKFAADTHISHSDKIQAYFDFSATMEYTDYRLLARARAPLKSA